MAKPNTDFYDCYIAAEELRDVMWSLRNAHETITDSDTGFTLKQRSAGRFTPSSPCATS